MGPSPDASPLLSPQYACGIEAEVVGKPSPEFFRSALQQMGVEAHQVGCSHGVRVAEAALWGGPGHCAGAAVGHEGLRGSGGLRRSAWPAAVGGPRPESWFGWRRGGKTARCTF